MDKNLAMQLMMWVGLNNDKALPVPAILRPKPLWTGKQILSLILPNVNMIRYTHPPSSWSPPTDTFILIERGELISGFLNKLSAGSS